MREGRLSRRSLLIAAGAGVAVAALARARYAPAVEWRGMALGADARILLAGASAADSDRAIAASVAEIGRLERIFSLYLAGSELVHLNGEGALAHATPELRHLLAVSRSVHTLTDGLFDPTVQPLWQAYAGWHGARGSGVPLPQDRFTAAMARVGLGRVTMDGRGVRLADGGALTLNGIAQGYITDCVAALLRRQGFDSVLVDIGEVRALGARPDGRPFAIDIRESGQRLGLADGALATSSPSSLLLAREQGIGHILDPRTGLTPARWRCVTVRHASAALADGLSTALTLASDAQARRIVAQVPGCAAWLTDGGGDTRAI